ncbi:peptidylprolyl isomerase [Rhodobacteraceae bacterium 2CG4]|uniref:Peptidyl-prolyl cis-trans isomerase n=1 Tax=Halovulum marinum TaxID=2662447 RepID=A0A6L5Z489_9RHOB|nr:peptidylprolyl isomerase [Halovulum marinum]MSU91139.1 peptidylprolyl isomerase [Halovulum marinum]
MSKAAEAGDTLRLHYTGTFEDGTVFDSSDGRDPLEFTLGSGQIIPGLDKGVTGMEVGEERSVTVPPADAYGERDDKLVQSVPRETIPDNIPTDPGTQLQMQTPQGQQIPVVVTGVTDEHVELDANHPLAGKTLKFEVKLVEIA